MEFDYILTFDEGEQSFGGDRLSPFFPNKEDAVAYFKELAAENDSASAKGLYLRAR